MATFCDGIVQNIDRTECIGNSLVKINNNFTGLENAGCDLSAYVDSLNAMIVSLSSTVQGLSNSPSAPTIPVGTVSSFLGKTVPTGWLAADGSAILIATYQNLANMLYVADLYNATATFGYKCTTNTNPNSTRSVTGTYIKLPDLRGYFVRGLGTNADGSASVGYGSIQADALKSHTHITNIGGVTAGNSGFTGVVISGGILSGGAGTKDYGSGNPSTGASEETRPKNIPLIYCIKY